MSVTHLLHGILLLDHLGALVLLPLIKTDIAEEDGTDDVDVRTEVFVKDFLLVLVTNDGEEHGQEDRLHQDDREDEEDGLPHRDLDHLLVVDSEHPADDHLEDSHRSVAK